jgi:predicted acylesterase/phospholipase RssA
MTAPEPRRRAPRRYARVGSLAALAALFLLWSWAVQSLSSAGRLAADAAVFLAAYAGVVLSWGRRRRGPVAIWTSAAAAAAAAWLALSALEPLAARPLPRDRGRFSRAPRADPGRSLGSGAWPATAATRVGVALSGGGFRAAAYHAGVLDALDRLGVPVTNLSTVSGGSIIGAFYALGGEPRVFRDALEEGAFNLRRQLALAQNLLRLPLPGFDRRTVQADLLRRRLALHDRERRGSTCDACPRLVIGATDLNFGMQVGFLDQGLLLANEAFAWSQHHPEATGLESLDLATRVSISGAFPGAFPPARVEVGVRRQAMNFPEPAAMEVRRSLVLADGGIADNSGLLLLRSAQRHSQRPPASLPGWPLDFIVVSDGGAVFGLGGDPGALGRLQRAVDVIAARGSQGFRRSQARERDLLWLSPQSSFHEAPILFDAPVPELSRSTLASVEQTGWFSPFAYPDAILLALGEVLLEDRPEARESLTAFLTGRRATLPYPAADRHDELRAISHALGHSRGREECAARAAESPLLAQHAELRDLTCGAVELRSALRAEIDRLSLLFRDTPTLRDQLGPGVARELFALGQAQALLAWPQLGRLMSRVELGPLPDLPGAPSD